MLDYIQHDLCPYLIARHIFAFCIPTHIFLCLDFPIDLLPSSVKKKRRKLKNINKKHNVNHKLGRSEFELPFWAIPQPSHLLSVCLLSAPGQQQGIPVYLQPHINFYRVRSLLSSVFTTENVFGEIPMMLLIIPLYCEHQPLIFVWAFV